MLKNGRLPTWQGLLYFTKSDILRNLNEIDILRNYDEGKLYFAKLLLFFSQFSKYDLRNQSVE